MQLTPVEVAELYRDAMQPLLGNTYAVQFKDDPMGGLVGRCIVANAAYMEFANVQVLIDGAPEPTDAPTVVVFRDNIQALQKMPA